MLYRKIIAVCSEIHTKHINTLCGQNVELLNVKLAVHIPQDLESLTIFLFEILNWKCNYTRAAQQSVSQIRTILTKLK